VNKRSRLDLSAGVAADKRQAEGFEKTAVVRPKPELVKEPASAGNDRTPQPNVMERGLLSPPMVIKAITVILAALLSLYLFKRRFF
jgi:hypothetical protein